MTDFVEEEKADFELAEGRLPENANEVVVGSHFASILFTDEEIASEGEEELQRMKEN